MRRNNSRHSWLMQANGSEALADCLTLKENEIEKESRVSRIELKPREEPD
jgi:hypothetical protein